MTYNSLENIYNEFRSSSSYSLDYTLDFFKRNAIRFNNQNKFKDENELKFFIELAWQNLNALYQKGRFNETADNAIKYLKTIDTEINQSKLTFIKDDWYFGILLFEGMATYRLRDYKTSTSIFKELTRFDAKNENYKNWLNYSNYGKRQWISKTITILCGLLLLIEIFFKIYNPSFFLRFHF